MAQSVNAQSIFLNKLRTEQTKVNVFLSDKTRLHGVIVGFDDYTIVLEKDGKQTLIYKNSISSIAPQTSEKPIRHEQ